jgi:hypothetical protein
MPRRYKMLRKTRRPARPFKLMVTVAIAYNKGAYQVIPAADIKHIGR